MLIESQPPSNPSPTPQINPIIRLSLSPLRQHIDRSCRFQFDMTSPLTLFISLSLLSAQLAFVATCDIWKAAECPTGPSKSDEDLMKSRHYSEEQLSAYCDAGKAFHDCVNEHLLCCDMKHEYNAALTSLDLQLRRNAVRVGRYCAEMNETNPIQYRCRTTVKTIEGIKHRRGSTTTKRWKPICDVDRVSAEHGQTIRANAMF